MNLARANGRGAIWLVGVDSGRLFTNVFIFIFPS